MNALASTAGPCDSLPRDLVGYREILQSTFGYPDFRGGQGETLACLADIDVMAVMPTGSGKSLCYILPALVAGRCLVVSPLIALMQDQVDSLRAAGVAAACINSSLTRADQNRVYVEFVRGDLALLYVAPERFNNARFVAGLRTAGVNLLAIDEAHCVSEWGHDFRPDYLTLGTVRKRLGLPRTLALTATARPRVQRDILEQLGIQHARTVVSSVDRPNLKLAVEHAPGASARLDWLLRYLVERQGQAGIIYARTRRTVETMAAALRDAGIRAAGYHAGLAAEQRSDIQRRFTLDETPVIVATNAFGLGIDKPDVRFVVHFNMPGRLESYYQEVGRAGRDGEEAECTLLYDPRDASAQQGFIARAHPEDSVARQEWRRWVKAAANGGVDQPPGRDRLDGDTTATVVAAFRASGLIDPAGRRLLSLDPEASIDTSTIAEHRRDSEGRLRQMVEYAESSACRRAMILRYFGEDVPPGCTSCDNCASRSRQLASATVERSPGLINALLELRRDLAQRLRRAPFQVFEARTAREVASRRPRTRQELIRIWGIGEIKADWFGGRILEMVNAWEKDHPDAVEREPLPDRPERRPARRADSPTPAEYDHGLDQRLRTWRRDVARRENNPAFTVMSDRTLREIVAARPADLLALSAIRGMGEVKLSRYGRDLLAMISPGPHDPPRGDLSEG